MILFMIKQIYDATFWQYTEGGRLKFNCISAVLSLDQMILIALAQIVSVMSTIVVSARTLTWYY